MARKRNADRNRAVLSFLKAADAAGGRFPSPARVDQHLRARRRNISDGMSLGSRRLTKLSILGTIPAGFGEPAEPVELGSIPVDLEAMNIAPSARVFALRVRGDSMTGAQIADGDLVIVEAREPRVGEIVAALIDGETTLKRFLTEGGQLFLKAENPKYPDLIPLRELTVQGVVRAVVRVCTRSSPTP